jgi:hypothetical protein
LLGLLTFINARKKATAVVPATSPNCPGHERGRAHLFLSVGKARRDARCRIRIAAYSGCGSTPYPPSPVIKNVTWDFKNLTRAAEESDLFPVTWAGDNNLYTAWGDGWGFTGWHLLRWTKKYLGVSRISGGPNDSVGTDLWSGTGKSHGIISVSDVLYMMGTEQRNSWSRSAAQ